VSYASSNTAVATVDSSTGAVTIVGAGSATITASQASSSNHNAPSNATYALTVAKATPTLSSLTARSKTFGDAPFTQTTSSASTGAVSYASSNTAVATVDSSTGRVTIVGAGSATITASQASSSNHNETSATYVLTVASGTSNSSSSSTAADAMARIFAATGIEFAFGKVPDGHLRFGGVRGMYFGDPPAPVLTVPGSPAALPASLASGGSTASGSVPRAAVFSTSPATGQGGAQVSVIQPLAARQEAYISVTVSKGTAGGSGFGFPLPAHLADAIPQRAPMTVTTLDGAPLPAWLRYVPETRSFTAAAVPAQSLPLQVQIVVGQLRAVVVISERSE
jgi:hypothetical protein